MAYRDLKSKKQKVNKKIEIIVENTDILKLQCPFTMLVAGGSQSGKSTTILEYLKNPEKIFNVNFEKIIYISGSGIHDSFNDPDLKHIKFTKDLSSIYNIERSEIGQLIIIDDLATELTNDPNLQNIFTKGSHHTNTSIIFIAQSIFYNSPTFRIIKENTNYYLIKKFNNIFKLKKLAYQVNIAVDVLMETYKYITSKNRYNALLIDLHIRSNLSAISPMRYDLLDNPKLIIEEQNFDTALEDNLIEKTENGNKYILH